MRFVAHVKVDVGGALALQTIILIAGRAESM